MSRVETELMNHIKRQPDAKERSDGHTEADKYGHRVTDGLWCFQMPLKKPHYTCCTSATVYYSLWHVYIKFVIYSHFISILYFLLSSYLLIRLGGTGHKPPLRSVSFHKLCIKCFSLWNNQAVRCIMGLRTAFWLTCVGTAKEDIWQVLRVIAKYSVITYKVLSFTWPNNSLLKIHSKIKTVYLSTYFASV